MSDAHDVDAIDTHHPDLYELCITILVTLSPKFQVVIPKLIREKLRLSAGQKIQAIVNGDRIELIPLRPAKELRGFLKGIDTRVDRATDRL